MRRDFTMRKNAILAGTILLVLADLALAAYSWQMASAPQELRQDLRVKLLQKDLETAQKIRDDTPKTKKDCDSFEQSLFPASTGSSTVSSELEGLAKNSGIRLEDQSFKSTEIPNRRMTEVTADLTVSGDYKNVIQFLNGVQRSTQYQVDSLTLGTDNANQQSVNVIKVALHLKTYFRAAP
jgi:Tfp pilus assembly protein PilO